MTANSRLSTAPLQTLMKEMHCTETIRELADTLHVSQKEISRYLSAEFPTAHFRTVDKICCAVGVHMGQLYPEYYE